MQEIVLTIQGIVLRNCPYYSRNCPYYSGNYSYYQGLFLTELNYSRNIQGIVFANSRNCPYELSLLFKELSLLFKELSLLFKELFKIGYRNFP